MLHSLFKYEGIFHEVENISGALELVRQYRIKSEVIGQWLFCFTTPLIGFQLEAIGFWYSFKHCAYIFTGNPKEGPADDESLDEIRARLGSFQIIQ